MATNLQSKSSEYCLLGHEEDPAGLTLSQGGGGRRGASEPIGVPSKGGTSAPIKPQQATGQATGRKNMPLPSIPQDSARSQPLPQPHPPGSSKETSSAPPPLVITNDPTPPLPNKKRSANKKAALSESTDESDVQPEVSDSDMSTSPQFGQAQPDVGGSGRSWNPAGMPLPQGANPKVSAEKLAKPVPKPRTPSLSSRASPESTGDSTPPAPTLPARAVRSPPAPEPAGGPALPPRPSGMRPPATLKR